MKNHTILLEKPVFINETATIAGPKEGKGPLKNYFNNVLEDDLLKEKSHEHAEIKIHTYAIRQLLNRSGLTADDIDCCFAGDLMDEIIGANFSMRDIDVPFFGIYNACATFGEGLILASSLISTGLANRAICSVSSHFATAERQYRNPLELGCQRTPLSQWTVTGGAASLLESENKSGIAVTCGTVGKVVDFGVTDANNMGAAMAPAALDTLMTHLGDTGRDVDYYDLIATGDLGHAGSRLLMKMAKAKGVDLSKNYNDCGVLIYNREAQKVEQGGSGPCCSGLVFNGYLYSKLKMGLYKKILLIPTGALLSKTSSLQGESIPGIAHAVSIEVL
ncbi:MAG: stage V sporulation protein AD [Christensenellales bacterium]